MLLFGSWYSPRAMVSNILGTANRICTTAMIGIVSLLLSSNLSFSSTFSCAFDDASVAGYLLIELFESVAEFDDDEVKFVFNELGNGLTCMMSAILVDGLPRQVAICMLLTSELPNNVLLKS